MEISVAYYEIEKYQIKLVGNYCTTTKRKYYDLIIGIVKECPEVMQFWEINPDKHFYRDRVKLAKKFNGSIHAYTRGHFAYILYLKDCEMIKVGKSSRMEDRMRALEKQYGELEVLHAFEFYNTEDAYLMEVLLHKYFKEKYPFADFIPQDRFGGEVDFTIEDLKNLELVAAEIKTKKWF